VSVDPDAYSIWGDWDLDQFRVKVAHWRDTTHPPSDAFDRVNQWWQRLKQPMEWSGSSRLRYDLDPQGNLRWMWVPDGSWLDENAGYFRVQCWFRIIELDRPPRLVCEEFRTVRALNPAEIDRSDGLG
jgi:hypothetical protein